MNLKLFLPSTLQNFKNNYKPMYRLTKNIAKLLNIQLIISVLCCFFLGTTILVTPPCWSMTILLEYLSYIIALYGGLRIVFTCRRILSGKCRAHFDQGHTILSLFMRATHIGIPQLSRMPPRDLSA